MKLNEILANTFWIPVPDDQVHLVHITHVFTPAKRREAVELEEKYRIFTFNRPAMSRLRETTNGFHVLMVGTLLPEEIPFIGMTRAQVERWISQHGHNHGHTSSEPLVPVEFEAEPNDLSREELINLLDERVDD